LPHRLEVRVSRRRSKAPRGADVLYSKLIACELRHGLIYVEVRSRNHTEAGLAPLSVAMELHHKLGLAIDALLRANVTKIPETRRARK
jgi:hypothetical protein